MKNDNKLLSGRYNLEKDKPAPQKNATSDRLQITYYSKATGVLPKVNKRNFDLDTIEKKATFHTKNNIDVIIDKYESSKDLVGVRADKLLKFATAKFTEINNFKKDIRGNTKKDPNIQYMVKIGVEEFARAQGKNIDIKTHHEDGTPLNTEELKKEERRVKSLIDKTRASMQEDRIKLATTTIILEEKINGKEKDFILKYVGSSSYDNGYVKMFIDQGYAEILRSRNTLTYQDKRIYAINNNDNAYSIYDEMHIHYTKVRNYINGTNNRLKVKTLLSYTTLKTIEEVRATNGSWRREIQNAFEKIIEFLIKNQYITVPTEKMMTGAENEEEAYCYYGLPNGEILSLKDKQSKHAIEKMTFEEWSELNVYFKPTTSDELDKILEDLAKSYKSRTNKAKKIANRRTNSNKKKKQTKEEA